MLRFFIGALALLLSLPVDAQVLTRGRVSNGAVSSVEITKRLELSAIRTMQSGLTGAARGSLVDFAWPETPEEYRALAKHVLVLVSAVTQDAAELPLRRVYVSANGRVTELVRLSSQRSKVAKASTTFLAFGTHREDGFYLAPAGAMMADGYLQADFAIRRTNFNLYKLPATPPAFIRRDSDPAPAADAKPETAALRAILHREYKGFELPASLR